MRSNGWALIQYDWCPYKKKILGHRHAQREDHVKTKGKHGIYKPRRDTSEEINPVDTLSQISSLYTRE